MKLPNYLVHPAEKYSRYYAVSFFNGHGEVLITNFGDQPYTREEAELVARLKRKELRKKRKIKK